MPERGACPMRPRVRQKGKRMKTKLLDGYFIDQRKPDNFDLKKTYLGKRNGIPAECEKTLSHHPSFESAAEAFVRLYQGDKTTGEYKSLVEYIDALKQANAEAVNAVQESKMQHFFMYVPKGNGVQADNRVDDFVSLLLWGEENAIGRKLLVAKAVNAGLIPESIKDKDRAMRILYEKAKLDYAICHTKNGYFRPLPKDRDALDACIEEDDKKALSILRGNSMRKKLKADFDAGRL